MRTFNINVSKYFTAKIKLGEVLHKVTSLDPAILSDAAQKGAVWIQKGGKGKILKLRSTDAIVDPTDKVNFYYDPRVLSYPELTHAECVLETQDYGIWIKPAGVLPQGTQTGDHTALLRIIEKLKKKEVYLIHRLDRETEGLMVVGYTSDAASRLSDLFAKNKIIKTYQAIVKGELERGLRKTITDSLDGKEAITHFEVLENANGKSLLEIRIDTGRLHQIRRHLDGIGHPVMGDPKYGKGNKNREGLKLLAKSLAFKDPWTAQRVEVALGSELVI